MTIEKSDFKMLVLNNMGAQCDDMREQALADTHRYEGATQFAKQAIQNIQGLLARVDKDIEEGKFESLEEASKAKKNYQTCANMLENMATKAEIQLHITRGKVEMAAQVIGVIKKEHDAEKGKAEAVAAAQLLKQEPPDPTKVTPMRRPVGVHPGIGLKASRTENGHVNGTNGTAVAASLESLAPPAPRIDIKRGRTKKKPETQEE